MSTEDDMWQDYDYYMHTGELSEYFEDECFEDEYEEEECVREVQEKPTKTNPKSVKHENVPKVKTIENELHPKSWTKKQKGVQFIYEISI